MVTSKLCQISRSIQVGQRIGVVSAIDHDSGIDGVIQYEMQGSAARYLSIDPSTGQIMLLYKLNRYDVEDGFEFRIVFIQNS